MDYQKTINKEISHTGVGLHMGNKTTVTFKPAVSGSGIKFVRLDLPGKPEIPAHISSAVDAPRRTTLKNEAVEIHTVEHILAALAGLGLDNLTIEVNANEVPEIDGSALPFVKMLTKSGLVQQDKPRLYAQLTEPVFVSEGESYLAAFPAEEFRISCTIDYNHAYLKVQFASFPITQDIFEKEIAGARTFCLEHEAKALQAQGLGRGANFENTIVIGEKGVVKGKLRFADEFVRHKILDLVGDLSLLGRPLKAQIIANRPGHSLNIKLVRALKKMLDEKNKQPQSFSGKGLLGGGLASEPKEVLLDIEAIRAILPHRYPFLLVDKIIEMKEDEGIVGIKNVTFNEPFFQGHFPERPIMPGVLIIEALAQTAGVLMLSKTENQGKLAYLIAVDKVKLRKPVLPGDQLVLDIKVSQLRSKTGKVKGRALVEGKVVTEAELTFALVEA